MKIRTMLIAGTVACTALSGTALAQVAFTKVQVGDRIRKVEELRRKFDPTDKWLETRPQVENVMDDARKINQVLVRGKYGTQAERYWAVLRESINDLARCYNLTPLAL